MAAESLLRAHTVLEPTLNVTLVSGSATEDVSTLDQLFELEQVNALIGHLLIADPSSDQLPSRQQIAHARRWLRRTTKGIESSSAEPLGSFSARVVSAFVRFEMAIGLSGRPQESDDLEYDSAVRLARWLASRRDSLSDRRLSETVQTEHCRRATQTDQHDLAIDRWTVLIGDLQKWSAADPGRIDYLQSLAHALLQRGNCLVALGKREEATTDYERSIETIENAWRMTDDDDFYRMNLATAQNNLGQLVLNQASIELKMF